MVHENPQSFFRGGASVVAQPDDYRVKNGLVQTTHGVSVSSNAEKVRRWGIYRVVQIPPQLQVKQRGRDSEHFEIVPTTPMSVEDYQSALARVVLELAE